MDSVSSLDTRSAGGNELEDESHLPPILDYFSESESYELTISREEQKKPRYLSSPELFKQLQYAPSGRNDGSHYGAATVWDPFAKIHVYEPHYDMPDEGIPLCEHYDEFLKRQGRKKNSIAGLDELIEWTKDELEYNERLMKFHHRKYVVPADRKLRRREYDDSERQAFAEVLLNDWDHRNNVRKTKEELSYLYSKRSYLEEEEIARDYLITEKEEDEWFGIDRNPKKLKF